MSLPHSESGRIKKLLIKHPKDAFISQENVNGQWQQLNYYSCPDYKKAVEEYDRFFELLSAEVEDIYLLPQDDRTGIDSLYPRDCMIATKNGVILCNMGKEERLTEPEIAGEFMDEIGVPILGRITDDGRIEGGDLIWLDDRTLVVGRGYRTNDEGIRQLKKLTADLVDDLIVVPLPHWEGPTDVFHLMSIISPIDKDLAVVYSRLMSVPFRELLLSRGIRLIDVPDSEFESMACNILAVAPRKAVMISGNPHTKMLLETEGVEVLEIDAAEICRKGAGGPTCMTRPLFRE